MSACATKAPYSFVRSCRIIQDVPNLSRSIAKRKAKKVSCIGMTLQPSNVSPAFRWWPGGFLLPMRDYNREEHHHLSPAVRDGHPG